ncbi:hypothetical protein HGRIS_008009 [Hohenbuehelia grisea]|uniref:Uncharacterized protein n=1 Tax=Hohenbuehelia grisea TaxID=104357 RepID=A0ABR3J741_9AGAR
MNRYFEASADERYSYTQISELSFFHPLSLGLMLISITVPLPPSFNCSPACIHGFFVNLVSVPRCFFVSGLSVIIFRAVLRQFCDDKKSSNVFNHMTKLLSLHFHNPY